MVYVPAGEFLMGSTDADTEAFDDEKPQHKVYLDAFWIDRTEVTNAQYQQCVDSGTCAAPICSGTGKGDHPVVCVSIARMRASTVPGLGDGCRRKRSGRRRRVGRMGGSIRGATTRQDCNRVNYLGVDGGCVVNTTAVGSYPSGASAYGALDMAGNVWEWVADWYNEKYYANSPAENPPGPDSGDLRVLRGGSWYDLQWNVRAAVRFWLNPDVSVHRLRLPLRPLPLILEFWFLGFWTSGTGGGRGEDMTTNRPD